MLMRAVPCPPQGSVYPIRWQRRLQVEFYLAIVWVCDRETGPEAHHGECDQLEHTGQQHGRKAVENPRQRQTENAAQEVESLRTRSSGGINEEPAVIGGPSDARGSSERDGSYRTGTHARRL
jgi:hypothetical protein